MSVKAEYLMVGGFLGAGKTTAMLRLAQHLTGLGRRVGLIANDQSHGLVDTVWLSSQGFAVEEITGGCLCCRFDSLAAAAERLARRAAPDVFLAEPVGSCTDLRATVQYPLQRLYGGDYRVGPLSVLVDPFRALRILGLEQGAPFSPKILYIYRKQLEEADLILINKCDLLRDPQAARLEEALQGQYPQARVLRVSARETTGLDRWFAALTGDPGSQRPPEVDYDEYAEGEAMLGWLNATIRMQSAQPLDGNQFLLDLAQRIRARLRADSLEIAHLKITLGGAVLNLVSTNSAPEFSRRLNAAVSGGELVLNLRAEASPELLRQTVENSLAAIAASTGAQPEIVQLEDFRPARPAPTHRSIIT